MNPNRRPHLPLRTSGRLAEAVLIFLKQVTANARWVFAVLLVLYAVSGIQTIKPEETALLRRMGHLQPKAHGPGLLVALPSPFDEVLRFETAREESIALDAWKIRGPKIADPDQPIAPNAAQVAAQIEGRGSSGGSIYPVYADRTGASLDPVTDGYSVTSDFNIIQGAFTLRYRIEDPFAYATIGDRVTALLERLGYRAIASELANRPIDASLTGSRMDIAKAAEAKVQADSRRLGLGVRVTGFDLRELSPPSQVMAAFEDVTNARQTAKTMYENSRQYHGQTIAKYQGDANAILHRASGYASGLVAEAKGESAAFEALLDNYHRQPALVARRFLRESLDHIHRNMNSRTLAPSGTTQPVLILEPAPEFAR